MRHKIVHIIPTLNRGGAERVVVDLLANLNKKSFEPFLIVLSDEGTLRKEVEEAGIPMVFVPRRFTGRLLVSPVAEILKEQKPDIVHTHLFGGDAWGSAAAQRAGVGHIVSTEHNVNRDESLARRTVKRRALKHAERIIAVSKAAARFVETVYRVPSEKIIVIPNGIVVSRYNREYQSDEQFRIGSIGRLEKQKGYEYLIDALSVLPDREWQCVIAGAGSRLRSLEDRVRKRRIADRVQFIGNREDIPALLATLDVFVLPSLWEGQGIVLLEAGCSEIPIIASRVDGIAEMLAGKEAALLVAPGDAQGLMAAIRWVREHPDAAQRMAKRWKKIVEQEYTIKKMVLAYEAEYQNILNA